VCLLKSEGDNCLTYLVAETVTCFQITGGYFTWTDGPPTLSNVDIKIPFGERQKMSPLCVLSVTLFPFFLTISLPPSHQMSQVSWPWLWARWAAESPLCCWQHLERCRECREQWPGTSQFCIIWISLKKNLFMDCSGLYLQLSEDRKAGRKRDGWHAAKVPWLGHKHRPIVTLGPLNWFFSLDYSLHE